jgi:hypothetical protein
MKTRLLSILSSSPTALKVKHYLCTPAELSAGVRQQMGSAAYLVIETSSNGVFLYRYNDKGECVGDTWHMTVDDARHQADYEYGGLLQEWQDVPEQVEDAAFFGLTRLSEASRNPDRHGS